MAPLRLVALCAAVIGSALPVAECYAPGMGAVLRGRAASGAAPATMRTPLVPFKVPNSEYFQWVGVYDRMARERILFLSQPLNDGVVNQMIATLLYLENEDRKSAVNLYLNVPGALTKSGLALYDTMRTMAFPIGTVNLGVCAHMGAFICAAGTKGRRVALPRSRFILTSPYMVQSQDGEVPIMQAEDIGREVAEVLRDRTRLVKGYAELTGQDEAHIAQLIKRNAYFDAQEALDFGLVDSILQPKKTVKAQAGDEMGFGVFNSAASEVTVDVTSGGSSGSEYVPQTM